MTQESSQLHVRFSGRSYEIPESSLELPRHSEDSLVLRRVARWLGVDASRLADHVVDRRPGGQLVVRPEAIYG